MKKTAQARSVTNALLCISACTAAIWAAAPSAMAQQPPQQVISSSGPLTSISLNNDLRCQVQHAADTVASFYPGSAPGSCGTFIAVPDPVQQTPPTVYGPFLGNQYTLAGQTGVTGSGSSSDPLRVTTEVLAGATGLRITQTDSYVVGQEFYRTAITVSNSSPSDRSAVLYHAADCFLQDSDSGYGFFDSASGGIFCSANPNNSPAARVLGFVPISSGSHYYEARYSTVYAGVNGSDFPDICQCDVFQDNGAGLSWSINVPAGGSVSRSLATAVSPTGVIPDTDPPPPPPPPPDTTPPDTPITSGPPASGLDSTPTFVFGSTEPASRFECSLDGAPFVPCTSPFTTARLAVGRHTLAVRAIDAAGNVDPTPSVYVFEIGAATVAQLPDPQVGVDVNVQELSGQVLVGIRAGAARAARDGGQAQASQKGIEFVPLSQARQIPVGSFLDTRRGTVRLQSARNRAGARQTGDFAGSIFQVKQSRKRRARGLTDLVLKGGNFRRCATGRRGKGASAAQSRTIRRHRGSASGRFRTSARNSSATVRGTVWEVRDRCDGTLTTVRRGRVLVRDFRRKRNILLTAGKSYLAKAPG
jgi:hypothetical protein